MVLIELRWRTSEFDGETTPFYAIPCPLELPTDISNTLLLELVRKEDTLEEVGEGIDDIMELEKGHSVHYSQLRKPREIIWYVQKREMGNFQFESECDILAREGGGKLSMARRYEKHDYNLKKI